MNDQYPGLYHSFQWLVPTHFNIAEMCCRQWASNPSDARRIAFLGEDAEGNRDTWSYGRLGAAANQLANGLLRMGIRPGERVAVILGQRAETIAAHMAAYSIGAVTVPLSAQSGPGALSNRLRDADVRTAIVDAACAGAIMAALERIPALQQIISLDFSDERTIPWRSLLARQPDTLRPVATRSSDPALLLYPAGATGASKGVLLPHAALIGNLPGFVASQNWFPQPGDVFWTPSDWASGTGLMNALLPALYFGMPIVGTQSPCGPERALELLERYAVTNAFLSPATLDALMKSAPELRAGRTLSLRAIASSGAPLGAALFEWCRSALGVTPNETFGLAEANQIIGNSHARWPAKPGSMGRPIPGHNVAILDGQGLPLSVGQTGELAVSRLDIHGAPDPVLFLGYWRDEAATRARHTGNWFRTGDLAWRDEDGDFWHAGPAPRRAP